MDSVRVYFSFLFSHFCFLRKGYSKYIPVILGHVVCLFVFFDSRVEAAFVPRVGMPSVFSDGGKMFVMKSIGDLSNRAIRVFAQVKYDAIEGFSKFGFCGDVPFYVIGEAQAEEIHEKNTGGTQQVQVVDGESIEENHARALKYLSVGLWIGWLFSSVSRWRVDATDHNGKVRGGGH